MIGRAVIALSACLCCALACGKAVGAAGGSCAEEIAFPPSALSAALSGASAGVVDDASAIQDNPARLADLGSAGMAGTYTSWPMDMRDSQVFFFAGRERWGALGIQARLIECSFTGYSENPDGSLGGEEGQFAYRLWQVGAAYAPDLREFSQGLPVRISAGVAGFIVQREMDTLPQRGGGMTASVAADFGSGMLGYAVCRNLGRLGREGLPLRGVVGAAIKRDSLMAGNDRATGVLEGSVEREGGGGLGVGGEYRLSIYPAEIALRAGYAFSSGTVSGKLPSAGIALKWSGFALDLAIAHLGDLGTAEVLTVSLQRESLTEAE